MTALQDIGFLGLGKIGTPMAERLLGHACRLHVYDPSADALAPFVDGGPSRMASIVFARGRPRSTRRRTRFRDPGLC